MYHYCLLYSILFPIALILLPFYTHFIIYCISVSLFICSYFVTQIPSLGVNRGLSYYKKRTRELKMCDFPAELICIKCIDATENESSEHEALITKLSKHLSK